MAQFFKQTIAVLASEHETNGTVGAIEVSGPRGAAPHSTCTDARTKRSTSSGATTASSSATT